MSDRWGLLALILPIWASGQVDSTSLPAMEAPAHRLTIGATGAYDSDALYNELVMGLYRGGRLSPEVRQRSLEAAGPRNRAGYALSATLTYSWGGGFLGHGNLAPRISLSHQSFLGLRFTDDAFLLSFFGNKQLEDRTAHIGPGAFRQTTFQQFRFGVEDRKTGSFLEVGVVNGSSLNEGRIQQADLYTSPSGQYLELDLDGSYRRSDTAAHAGSRGIGAAVAFRWRHAVNLLGHGCTISIGAADLGFIAWGTRSLAVDKDTLIHYAGLAVNGILDLDNLILDEHSLQDSLGLGFSAKGFSSILPAQVQAKLEFGKARTTTLGLQRHDYALAVEHRLLPGYLPHVAATRDFFVSDALVLGVGAGFGGFGGFRIRLGAEAGAGRHWTVGIHTDNALGFLPGRTRGKTLAFNAAWAW